MHCVTVSSLVQPPGVSNSNFAAGAQSCRQNSVRPRDVRCRIKPKGNETERTNRNKKRYEKLETKPTQSPERNFRATKSSASTQRHLCLEGSASLGNQFTAVAGTLYQYAVAAVQRRSQCQSVMPDDEHYRYHKTGRRTGCLFGVQTLPRYSTTGTGTSTRVPVHVDQVHGGIAIFKRPIAIPTRVRVPDTFTPAYTSGRALVRYTHGMDPCMHATTWATTWSRTRYCMVYIPVLAVLQYCNNIDFTSKICIKLVCRCYFYIFDFFVFLFFFVFYFVREERIIMSHAGIIL